MDARPHRARKPSATHPRIVSSATYRMLSQWMKPETKVIALPAENGVMGSSPSVTATIATVANANERSLRVFARTLTQPGRQADEADDGERAVKLRPVEIDGDGVVHRARHAVTLRVLPKRRVAETSCPARRGTRLDTRDCRCARRFARTSNRPSRSTTRRRPPRSAWRAGGAPSGPSRAATMIAAGSALALTPTASPVRDAAYQASIAITRALSSTLRGTANASAAKSARRQREIGVGEARRHHADAL